MPTSAVMTRETTSRLLFTMPPGGFPLCFGQIVHCEAREAYVRGLEPTLGIQRPSRCLSIRAATLP
jgi:hypothetical protein